MVGRHWQSAHSLLLMWWAATATAHTHAPSSFFFVVGGGLLSTTFWKLGAPPNQEERGEGERPSLFLRSMRSLSPPSPAVERERETERKEQ